MRLNATKGAFSTNGAALGGGGGKGPVFSCDPFSAHAI